MVKNNSSLILLAVLILSGLALYFIPLRDTSFCFDDYPAIVDNPVIKTIDLPKIFNSFNTRSLPGLSFAMNYHFCGLHPQGFRLVNLLIHCLNAFLVYLLLKATCRLQWPALFGSLLFLCHPLQTEPVNFITQRFVLMAGFFYLLTIVLYIHYRNRSQKIYLFAALFSATAAMFCKEFVVTLPVMMALYEFYFLDHSNETTGKRCRRLIPFFLIALIVPLLLLRTPADVTGVAAIAQPHDITRARDSAGRQEYFLTELNVLRTYVRLMFWPINQNFYYDYPLRSSIDVPTALSGIFLICLLAVAWATYRSYRMVSFGILWFFIALSVESSVIPIGDVITEYRPYLASVGFIFVIMSVLYLRRTDVRKLNMIAAAILVIFSILTFQRNLVWKNEFTLWNDTVKKSPHKAGPYNNRGKAYMDQGDLTAALLDFNRAVELNPDLAEGYCNRGTVYDKEGNYPKAIDDYDKALELDPRFAQAYINRGLAYDKLDNLSQAIADDDKAIEISPDNAQGYTNRGVVYAQQNDLTRAMSDFNKAISEDPEYEEGYRNRGLAYHKEGDLPQALADYSIAIALKPGDAQTYEDRGNIYAEQKDYVQAISDYNKAVTIDPQFASAYNNLAILYYQLKEYDNAWHEVDKMKALGAANPILLKALQQVSGQNGQE